MGRQKFKINDHDILEFIGTWSEAKEVAYSCLNTVVEETEKLNRAQGSGNRLEAELEEFLADKFFNDVRKSFSGYTTRMKKMLDMCAEDKSSMPISNETYEKLKIMNQDAMVWYKDFKKAKSSYESARQLYELTFLCVFREIDIREIL